MQPGALVVRRNRWSLNSRVLGIVIEESKTVDGGWLVLWSTKSSYSLQVHLEDALQAVDEEDKGVGQRGCLSA